jgi:hypothetical protein
MTGFADSRSEREELLDDIRASRAELEAILEQVSDEQMTNALDEGGWSIKDHLAHVAVWQRHGLALITSQPAHEAFGLDEKTYSQSSIDEINAVVHVQNKDRPLAEVLNDFRQTHDEVLTTIGRMDEGHLQSEIQPSGFTTKHRTIMELARGHFAGHDGDHVDAITALANQPT